MIVAENEKNPHRTNEEILTFFSVQLLFLTARLLAVFFFIYQGILHAKY
jgi:hypothetical protein